MNEIALYGIVLAFGFFWRWIDRIDKKIDKIFDAIDNIKDTHVRVEEHRELKERVLKFEEQFIKLKTK